MAELPTTLAESLKGLATEYIGNQVKTIAQGMGDKASDATPLSEQDELAAWMRATKTPEQVAQMIADGADDATILQEARKFRYHLGKAAAKGDPKKEVEYHEKMAAKAQAFMAEQAPMMGQGG